jgi:phage host-nuclease inhibitor protein Gam
VKKIADVQQAEEKKMTEMNDAKAKLMATFAENTEKKLAETVARLKNK